MDDRTVANELQNGSSQSSLACKSCRRKKLKCDRSIPQCRNCMKVSRPCDYPAVAHKPGPRPGTHRRNGDTSRTHTSRPRSIASMASSSPAQGTGSRLASESAQSPDLLFSPAGESPFSQACKMMRIPEQTCLKIVSLFFDNMTSFGLFHQPTFSEKLSCIDSAKQIQALLTSMFAFSIRFMKSSELASLSVVQPRDILERAYNLNHECLAECGDEAPPLHLLQGFILVTWLLSVHGVRGKAWRLLGECIQMAYELRLHEVDFDNNEKNTSSDTGADANAEDWIAKEEKRRAWWAVWESDIFASTIQRLPNGIDWSRSRTLLPSTDEAWYNGTPVRSCYFNTNPNKRWRDLRDSGNESHIAWFMLLNSYKFESLSVTGRMAPPTTFFDNEDHLRNKFDPADYRSTLVRKRETLENCIRCALGAIPTSLQLSDYLSFEPSRGPHPAMPLTHDNGIYMIHVMSQVTQLMILRKDLEGGNFIAYPADFTQHVTSSTGGGGEQSLQIPTQSNTERKRWQRCLLVADQMAAMVRNAAPNHYKHVNPNIATALWMAAAAQLAVLAHHRDEIDVELAQSNLDLLTTTIESFIEFWDVPKTLVQSLATLEQHLSAKRGDGSSSSVRRQSQRHPAAADGITARSPGLVPERDASSVSNLQHTEPVNGMPDMPQADPSIDLSPFDVLQAMDFGAMYNGVDNWENLFLDPGFVPTDFAY